MSNKRPTQVKRIEAYIKTFGSITTLDAFVDLGVVRLGARISEMRKSGMTIIGKQECVKNRFGEKCYIKRYSFPVEEKQA